MDMFIKWVYHVCKLGFACTDLDSGQTKSMIHGDTFFK